MDVNVTMFECMRGKVNTNVSLPEYVYVCIHMCICVSSCVCLCVYVIFCVTFL